MKLQALLIRLVIDDRGQDLIEYGLLASIVGIAGILVVPTIAEKMDAAFESWIVGAYDDWCPDDPGGGATCSVETPP
jgi:Flp pilus assembly pilin Flp